MEITLLQIKHAIFGYLGIKDKKKRVNLADELKNSSFPTTEMTEKEMNIWLNFKNKNGKQTFPHVGKFLKSIRK